MDEKTFILYAAKNYRNPQCVDVEEFHDDVKRLKYIKKILLKYVDQGELKERLVLNHLIALGNVFPPEPLVRMIFLRMNDLLPQIVPFLHLLGLLPKYVRNVGRDGRDYLTEDIFMDPTVITALRGI